LVVVLALLLAGGADQPTYRRRPMGAAWHSGRHLDIAALLTSEQRHTCRSYGNFPAGNLRSLTFVAASVAFGGSLLLAAIIGLIARYRKPAPQDTRCCRPGFFADDPSLAMFGIMIPHWAGSVIPTGAQAIGIAGIGTRHLYRAGPVFPSCPLSPIPRARQHATAQEAARGWA
jgi:hypothetical protein